ncbi:MAG: hypothetical protein ACLSF2_02390 [Butyricicoccus sp.]
MLVIVLLPLFGGLFYLFWGNTPLNRRVPASVRAETAGLLIICARLLQRS